MADSSTTLRTTALHDRHVALGARMMAFAGFDMPVQYTSIIEEHKAVRTAAGIFDVSHMGEVFVRGPHAFDFVQHLVTNDAAKLYDGKAMYTVMCREDGGIVDDLLVYRLGAEEYLLVINAANIDKDFAWMQAHNPMGAELENASEAVALLAVQGPKSIEIVQRLTDAPLGDLKYYHFTEITGGDFFGCERALLSRTGYTGELGLELYVDPGRAAAVWDAVLEAGADDGLRPAGLGARDTLRLEAGYALYGNDITDETNPLEAGLGWVVKLDQGAFVGREALQAVKARGPERRLVGFVMEARSLPRPGYPILDGDGEAIGTVTSGTLSPMLEQGIGMGYVPNQEAFTTPGAALAVGVRGRPQPARVQKPPFHKTD